MTRSGHLRRYALFGLAAVLLTVGALWLRAGPLSGDGQGGGRVLNLGGAFALTAGDGRPVTEASWPGHLLLIYFGYRYCPDVCPTSLQTMASALELLGRDGDRVQPLFISVDPERDPPETLPAYVGLFHPRLIGLTGTPEQVAATARTFRVYVHKVAGADPGSYSVDHSAYIFLTDDHGRVLTIFAHNARAAEMADAIRGRVRDHP